MENMTTKILIDGIRVPIDAVDAEIENKAKSKMKRAGYCSPTLHFRLYKKSIDARKREQICFVCSVLCETAIPQDRFSSQKLAEIGAKIFSEEPLNPVLGSETIPARPLVVGMGPAGLFAALILAQNGYRPILIDRGGTVEERVKDTAIFRESGLLDTESNIQFGAGGAGTFSDGKLVTRIHDPRSSFVLNTFVRFGAPKEILIKAKPHIGTDLLRGVISNMLREIERLGGETHYRCRLDDYEKNADGTVSAYTSKGVFSCGAILLAPGHSSRDTYQKLLEKNLAIEPKPISVGVRVEHLQENIDEALYGKFAGNKNLGPAEYALSDTTGARGVSSFCMCPGGEVAAASSENGCLTVNGMSYHARDGKNANAAIAVSVYPTDYVKFKGSLALGAIEFQRSIERAAFAAGGSDYKAPICTLGDFLARKTGTNPSTVHPSYRSGKTELADMDRIFPSFVTEQLRYGFSSFGKKIKGYDAPEAVLTAPETRTSAPLRILRNPDTYTAVGCDYLYPCGEGAGYAGGITSAAVDGIRSAMALMERFAAPKD